MQNLERVEWHINYLTIKEMNYAKDQKPQTYFDHKGFRYNNHRQIRCRFYPFERHLANLGLVFKECIGVVGIDPPAEMGKLITLSFFKKLPVTDGNDELTITREVSKTVPRTSLQEDSVPGDDDEIRCRIRIYSYGLPPAVTEDAFTDEQILVG